MCQCCLLFFSSVLHVPVSVVCHSSMRYCYATYHVRHQQFSNMCASIVYCFFCRWCAACASVSPMLAEHIVLLLCNLPCQESAVHQYVCRYCLLFCARLCQYATYASVSRMLAEYNVLLPAMLCIQSCSSGRCRKSGRLLDSTSQGWLIITCTT